MALEEKSGGKERNGRQMEMFRKAIREAELRDLGFSGARFTWSRGNQQHGRILERLDRALGNKGWCAFFPYSRVIHLTASYSDHAPILIITQRKKLIGRRRNRNERNTKFEQMWLSCEESYDIIRENWWKGGENPAQQIIKNNQRILGELSIWGRNIFGDIKRRIKKVKEQLKAIQGNLETPAIVEFLLKSELDSLLEKEEVYWEQRSKVS